MAVLEDLRTKLEAKENYVLAIQRQVKSPTDPSDVQFLRADALKHLDTEAAAREHMLALHEELKALRKEFDDAVKLQAMEDQLSRDVQQREQLKGGFQHPNGDGAKAVPAVISRKSFGEQAIEARFYVKGEGYGREIQLPGVDLKTLMTTIAGFPPESTRVGRIVDYPLRPIQLLDLVPTVQTTMAAIIYMEQTTPIQAATEVAEGGVKPEAEAAFTQRTSNVRKIAVWLPVTDEQLDDVPFLQAMLEQQLREDLLRRLDSQILVGNGTDPNLRGILNTAGIQTQAMGGDSALDAIYKALVKIRTTGRANPSAVAIHPTNWTPIRLATAAGSGMYLYGPPFEAGPERVWGVPVVMNEALTAGTAVAGDFTRYSTLAYRQGAAVQVSNSHSDYFIRNQQAIRAELRVAFIVWRPAAFATITGLT